jgi:hypothetical protein
MRKEDRVAAARQQQGRQESQKPPKPEPREQEKMRGATSSGQPQKPRQGGKLPLPD